MTLDLWVFIFLLLILIVLFILFFSGVFKVEKATPPDVEKLLEEVKEKSSWGTPRDVPHGTRNFCGVYTFVGTDPDEPAVPTFDPTVLNAITPVSATTEGCIDDDQIAAKQQIRTCEGDGDTGDVCVTDQGVIFQKGKTDIFYQGCDIQRCKDQFGILAFRFEPELDGTVCMSFDSVESEAVGRKCDINDSKQKFRFQRALPVSLKEDNSGPYLRIFERISGKCVVPKAVGPGSPLVLGQCSPNSGYVWLLAPPVELAIPSTEQDLRVFSTLEDNIFGFSFILSGEEFCLVAVTPQLSNNRIRFSLCNRAPNMGRVWRDQTLGGSPIEPGDTIKIELKENRARLIKSGFPDICLIPESIDFDGNILFTTRACTGDEDFVWELETPIPILSKVTPQQITYSATVEKPPEKDELVEFIQEKHPLSIRSRGEGNNLELASFSTDANSGSGKDYISQILDYQIYKIVTDTPNVTNTNINFPYYQWT